MRKTAKKARTKGTDRGVVSRDRLLEVAGEEFARRGFHDATVREICRKAEMNIAAIKYHFGDKAGLYREVFRTGFARFKEGRKMAFPPGGEPSERLRMFLRVFMERATGAHQPAWSSTLMMRELIEPTDALDEAIQYMLRPLFDGVAEVVAELLGRSVDDPLVLRTTASIFGQCLWYRHAAHIAQRLFKGTSVEKDTPQDRADHIATLTLAAIAGMRERTA